MMHRLKSVVRKVHPSSLVDTFIDVGVATKTHEH